MKEDTLRQFFLGELSAAELEADVAGSDIYRSTGVGETAQPIKEKVAIEDMSGQLFVTRSMLIALCDATITGLLRADSLRLIAFAILASDHFDIDGEDIAGDVLHDWSCPEVNFPLTAGNMGRFRDWLTGESAYPSKPTSPQSSQQRLVSVKEKVSI